jgi:hypothetical protein
MWALLQMSILYAGLSIFTLDMAFSVIPESVEGLSAMDDIARLPVL